MKRERRRDQIAMSSSSRSGSYVHEAQRSTEAVKLRLEPDVAELLRASAEHEELSLSEYVTRLVRAGQLETRLNRAYDDLDDAEWRRKELREYEERRASRGPTE